MAKSKTRPTSASVDDYLNMVEPEKKRIDAFALKDLLARASGYPPVMWGDNIVGYGSYHYKYNSGREGDWMITAFAPRSQNLVVYVMPGFSEYGELMDRLGTYRTGRSCLYINKLDDINPDVLEELIKRSVVWMKEKYDTA